MKPITEAVKVKYSQKEKNLFKQMDDLPGKTIISSQWGNQNVRNKDGSKIIKGITLSRENPAKLISYDINTGLAKVKFPKKKNVIHYVYFRDKNKNNLLEKFNNKEKGQEAYKRGGEDFPIHRTRFKSLTETISVQAAQELRQFERSAEVLEDIKGIKKEVEAVFLKRYPKFPIKSYYELVYLSILKQESNFIHKDKDGKITTSLSGVQGISQVTSDTAKTVNSKYGTEFETNRKGQDIGEIENLKLGYFAFLNNFRSGLKNAKLGNNPSKEDILAIAATSYNGGPGRVGKGFGIKNYKDRKYKLSDETRNYVPKIIENYKMYENIYLEQGVIRQT
jgi:hypothetical protein